MAVGAAGFLKQRGFRNSILDPSIIAKFTVPLLVLLEIDINDARSVLQLSGDEVAVYSESIHVDGVAHDALEHFGRHFVLEQVLSSGILPADGRQGRSRTTR